MSTAPLTLLPLTTFDLPKYLGTWFQFAATKQWYEPASAYNVTAVYQQPATGGPITVTNTLFFNGKSKMITGTLTPSLSADASQREFKVTLNNAILWFPVTSDYVVRAILTDEQGDYLFAVVGTTLDNANGTFYLLSRFQQPNCVQQQQLLKVVAELGYDASALKFTPQVCVTQPL